MLLHDLQKNFFNFLFDDSFIDKDIPLHPIENIEIYRTNIFESLSSVLGETYCHVKNFLGDDYFYHIAKEFVKKFPPQKPHLFSYGETFQDFLKEKKELEKWPYVSELAEIEWLSHISYYSANLTKLTPQKLSTIAETDYPSLKFTFCPSVFLKASTHPLYQLWAYTKSADESYEKKEISFKPEHILIYRRDFKINISEITEAMFCFLSSLKQEKTLTESLEEAQNKDLKFDLQTAILFCLKNELIHNYQL